MNDLRRNKNIMGVSEDKQAVNTYSFIYIECVSLLGTYFQGKAVEKQFDQVSNKNFIQKYEGNRQFTY